MEYFDLIVIGNGAAGDNIARTLGRRGVKTALIEREHLGGECLNDGCAPSKALIDLSKRAPAEGLSWSQVVARIHATQLLIRGSDPNGGLRADGVELIWGNPTFSAPTVLTVGARELSATNVVIATGTAPALPPIDGLAEARPQTNRTIFTMAEQPPTLAVIGGGPIGLELGQAFHRLGTEVTIFEAADRIAVTEDAEISLELTRLFERDGVRIVSGVALERVDRVDGQATVSTGQGAFRFHDILVAAGRQPQIPDGLDALNLERDKRGFITVQDCGRTNLPGLWASGDITGKFQFTHYASYQAHHIARHILDEQCHPVPDTLVPWAIFTEPEVGHAGMTEEQARAERPKVKVAVLRAEEFDWFRTTSQTDGLAKVIADGDSGVLLGAHFVCARGSTLVGEACLAIQHGITAQQVASTIHPYPTASELFRWACAKLV